MNLKRYSCPIDSRGRVGVARGPPAASRRSLPDLIDRGACVAPLLALVAL